MLNRNSLIRTADRINAYIENNVILAGADKRHEVLELFDKMQLLFPNWIIMTCPLMHPDLHYTSKNIAHIFGYDSEDLGKLHNIERYFNQVHHADQEDLHACFTYVHGRMESMPASEHVNYRTVFYYRFKKKNNQYMHLYDEKAVLHLPGSGNLYYVLMRDVSIEKPFTGVKVELFKQELVLHKILEYKPASERTILSKRENELINLIKQGLSTKEIAWYLKISHNTVRNIKSKMFEKYQVNNTIELLNMTT